MTSRWDASIRHDRYHPLWIRNSGFLQEFDNCDGTRCTTRSLLPQDRMWAYGIAAISHYRMGTQDFLRNLITVIARRTTWPLLPQDGMWAYGMAAITHCWMQTWNFFRNLITVMAQGIQHGCYYLKMGCEHMARLLSPTVEWELGTSSGTW